MPYAVSVVVPVVLMLWALPLILGWVPRNRFYGVRTPRTLAADEVWYPANRFGGYGSCAAGLVWLTAAGLAPSVAPANQRVFTLSVGLAAMCLALAATLVFVAVRSRD